MSKVSEQERRAAARAERAKAAQKPATGNGAMPEDGGEPLLDPGDALRTAASAAIAGAAVGAAKAIARRRQQEPAAAEAHEEPRDEEPAEDPAPVDEEQPELQPVAAAAGDSEVEDADEPEPRPEPEPEAHRPAEAGEVSRIVQRAREQLRDFRGMDAETVSSIRRTQGGWRVGLDVVEVKRVPDSTDVLGTYEVDLDDDGNLITFERVARYHRSEADRR